MQGAVRAVCEVCLSAASEQDVACSQRDLFSSKRRNHLNMVAYDLVLSPKMNFNEPSGFASQPWLLAWVPPNT